MPLYHFRHGSFHAAILFPTYEIGQLQINDCITAHFQFNFALHVQEFEKELTEKNWFQNYFSGTYTELRFPNVSQGNFYRW